jgi:release factor glutamine methyltransferase
MTYREFLAARSSEMKGGETSFLDASLILAFCFGVRRDELLARLPERLDSVPADFQALWDRRLSGEPIAYLLGKKEFFGREFMVDSRVLVPRPDTEVLVMAALEVGDRLGPNSCPRVHDVCTGSGIVAVTLAAERPAWSVSASDISRDALEVAARNIALHAPGKVKLWQADLLANTPTGIDIITANPPYVTSMETTGLLSLGWGEPRIALDGGADGLDYIRRLALEAKAVLGRGGYILIEMDPSQIAPARDIFCSEGYAEPRIWKDLSGKERVFGARRSG